MPISMGMPIAPLGQPISSGSGIYSFLGSNQSTSATLGNGTLRAAPVYVPKRVTLDRIGAEVTIVGDVGSTLRLGIYRDNGNLYPSALLLDAGTIPGDAIAVVEIAISLVLEPGVYWLAGVVQGVTAVQPTVRTALESPFCVIAIGSSSINADLLGLSYGTGIVTGALPASWATGSNGGLNASGAQPRIFVRAV